MRPSGLLSWLSLYPPENGEGKRERGSINANGVNANGINANGINANGRRNAGRCNGLSAEAAVQTAAVIHCSSLAFGAAPT
jgi:hypothetical protein